MSKIFYTVILVFLFLPAFCQYGNMNVIDPRDIAVCSENEFDTEGNLLFKDAGYMGVFVSVSKTSKVKLTVSAKSLGIMGEYPTLKCSCGKNEVKFSVTKKEWTDYSANFLLEPGTYFLKAENMVFPKMAKDRRSLFVERIYVSGNQCRLVNKIDEKTVLEVCRSEIKARKKTFTEIKNVRFLHNKYNFGYGICISEKSDDAKFIGECEKHYNKVICEKNEENINDEYTVGYVNGDDIYAKDLCERLHILIKDKAETNEMRIVYTAEKKKLEDVFRIIHSLKLYNIDLSLFDFYEEDTDKTESFVLLALAYCKSIVFNENCEYFSLDNIEILKPESKGKQNKKYIWELFPGEYKIAGENRIINID